MRMQIKYLHVYIKYFLASEVYANVYAKLHVSNFENLP